MTSRIWSDFLKLGLTSFGGPTAHLGYFRTAFVPRILSDRAYSSLVALCQILPGPASSQVGMGIGYFRGGFKGLLIAWAGFTLPSAIALAAFGLSLSSIDPRSGWLLGLLAIAAGVVAHAVWTMGRSMANTPLTFILALVALLLNVYLPSPIVQVASIIVAGLIYALLRPQEPAPAEPLRAPSRTVALGCLAAFLVLVIVAIVMDSFGAAGPWWLERFFAYFYGGALVFGGGHVVLPMLEATTTLPTEVFLSGYAAAQAVPGPLFTFASFLGAAEHGIPGAILATVAIFLPSALLILVGLHFWQYVRPNGGVNAAVVGILAAALINPVISHGVLESSNPIAAAVIAVAAFMALRFKVPPVFLAGGGAALGFLVL